AYAMSKPTSANNLWKKGQYQRLTQFEMSKLRDSTKELNGNRLGYGFNLVTELPTRNRCIINGSYQRIDNFSRFVEGQVVSSKSEVEEFFSTSLSLNAEGRYGSFSASSQFKRDMLNSFQNLEQNNTVAFVIQDKTYTLINDAWPTIDPRALALLQANTNISKTNFRNICGDVLVDGIQYGRELSLLLQVKSKTQQAKDVVDTAAEISASYMMLISGSADSKTLEQYRHYQQNYEIKVKAYVSGESMVLSDTNLLNFADKLREFESNLGKHHSVINYQTSAYQVPDDMDYWQAFKDYRPAKLAIQKWHQFMAFTHSEQCQYKDIAQVCAVTKQMYRDVFENCSNTYRWPSCLEPSLSECKLPTEQPCNYIEQVSTLVWQDAVVDWEQSYDVMFPKESLEINIIGYEMKLENGSIKKTALDLRVRLDKPHQFDGLFVCDLKVKEDHISMCGVMDERGVGKVMIEKLRYLIRQ
ncbi:hypothetical protein C1141_19220, partial [Vibrio agarivorans]